MLRRVTVDGETLNVRTVNMLNRAQRRYGLKGADWRIIQGSYNSGVGASAGTHDGGGALDLSCSGLDVRDAVLCLREVGFAAWHRVPSQGPWVEHIHAIAIGDPELSSGARFQVEEYYDGRNGLASRAPDDGPRFHPIPTWPFKLAEISKGRLVNQFTTDKPRNVPATRKVQRLLNRRINAGLTVDGIAGPKTRAAYKSYENRVGTDNPDGVPGPFTLKYLVGGFYTIIK